ncbi:MAG: prephenate dehydrogenase [Clostridium sp.]|uniref:prephenate dehydrogenase n=1 Tax=Clostridium sp. TaxID=1506 RepID=UPI003043A7FD
MGEFNFKVTVVGLGLIGGSLAMAIRKLNPIGLYGIDLDELVLSSAKLMGIIDEGSKTFTKIMEDSDIIIISTYAKSEVEFLSENIGKIKRGAIVTDSTGLKDVYKNEIMDICRGLVDYIGGHPMVGKETSSFQNASEEMLKGGSYILIPSEDSKVENVALLGEIAKAIGFTTVKIVDSITHDKLITYTSHIPHIMAVAMMNNELVSSCNGFIGGSFRDVTRVARINEDLWSSLFMDNKNNLIDEITKLQYNLENIKKILEESDKESLYKLLKASRVRKEHQNEKDRVKHSQ